MFQSGGWRRDTSDVMIFGLYFYEELQNIPKTVLGWKYIVLFIGLFVLLQKIMRKIIYLQGKRWPPYLI